LASKTRLFPSRPQVGRSASRYVGSGLAVSNHLCEPIELGRAEGETELDPESSDFVSIFRDPDGLLGVVEFSQLPFVPRRCFWLTDIAERTTRANHAHRVCSQLLFCLTGSVLAEVTSAPTVVSSVQLTVGDSLLVPPLSWLTLSNFSRGTTLGVLASTPYDQSEYVNSMDELRSLWIQRDKDLNASHT
jgi:UDP-2-acetamido-3-amino-2,3-dideoxy-glucuronate N-acetyltransferase